MSIWEECEGINCVKALNLEPWRVVESQHVSSSRDLVDSREEHDILEDLLEKSKPQIENNLHYLIFTPFRYPPLDYGSRFGDGSKTACFTEQKAHAILPHYAIIRTLNRFFKNLLFCC